MGIKRRDRTSHACVAYLWNASNGAIAFASCVFLSCVVIVCFS